MPNTAARDRVIDLLTPAIQATGLDLEDVELTPAGRRTVLRVIVDADGGVTLDTIADTSRQVAKLLDESDAMGSAPFTLEVTTRGVDRPLTEPRHWRRNVGRLIRVVGTDGQKVVGRIIAADETGAELGADDRDKKAVAPGRIEFADVARARIQIEFVQLSSRSDGDELDDELDDLPGEG